MAHKLINIINKPTIKLNNIIFALSTCINKGHDMVLRNVKVCKWCKSIVCNECITIENTKCINCTKQNNENWGCICDKCGYFIIGRICVKCGKILIFTNPNHHCNEIEDKIPHRVKSGNYIYHYCDECCDNLNEDKKMIEIS